MPEVLEVSSNGNHFACCVVRRRFCIGLNAKLRNARRYNFRQTCAGSG